MKKITKVFDEIPESWKLIMLLLYTAVILILGVINSYLNLVTIIFATALLFICLAMLITLWKPIALEKQLSDFIDKFQKLASYVEWQSIEKKGTYAEVLCSLNEIIETEEKAKEIWIITPDFKYDVNDFKKVIIKNLKLGKQYIYIYPSSNRARNTLEIFRNLIIKSMPNETESLNKQIKLYRTEGDIIPMTEVIYDPNEENGRLAVVLPAPRKFSYFLRLQEEQIDTLHDKFRYMMDNLAKEENFIELT